MKPKRKQLVGKVVSNKMDKTIVVAIEKMEAHSLYKKSMRRSKKIQSHDGKNECSIGDLVRVEETRPISRQKRYRLVEIVEKVR